VLNNGHTLQVPLPAGFQSDVQIPVKGEAQVIVSFTYPVVKLCVVTMLEACCVLLCSSQIPSAVVFQSDVQIPMRGEVKKGHWQRLQFFQNFCDYGYGCMLWGVVRLNVLRVQQCMNAWFFAGSSDAH
jgi:hypothetical protein